MSLTWKIFSGGALSPEDVLLTDAPGELERRGLPGAEVTAAPGEEIDAGAAFGFDSGVGKTAAAFTEIFAEAEETREFGFAAEWFFQLSVDGKIVFSCLEEGNGTKDGPLAHTAKIRLHKGRNLIAFFIRGGNRGLYFHFMELPPAGMPRKWKKDLIGRLFPPELSLRVLPTVTGVTETSAVISAEMGSPALMRLKYRPAGSEEPFAVTRNAAAGLFRSDPFQQFPLTGLRGGTEYEYMLEASGNCRDFGFRAGPFTFRTDSDRREHSLLLIGDTHQSVRQLDRFFRALAADRRSGKPDRLVHLGDIRSNYDDFDVFPDEYLAVQQQYFDNAIPCVFLRGNHEYRGEESGKFADRFGPTYGFFRLGEVCYLLLDTGWDLDGTGKEFPARENMRSFMEEQKRWLLDITASSAWKEAAYHVALAHAPMWSTSRSIREYVRFLAGDLFLGEKPAHRLDLWLCGDVHRAARLDVGTQNIRTLRRDERGEDAARQGYIPCPVVTLNAPNPVMPENSALRLDADASGVHVKHFFPGGETIDDFIIRPGGKVETVNSTLSVF